MELSLSVKNLELLSLEFDATRRLRGWGLGVEVAVYLDYLSLMLELGPFRVLLAMGVFGLLPLWAVRPIRSAWHDWYWGRWNGHAGVRLQRVPSLVFGATLTPTMVEAYTTIGMLEAVVTMMRL